MPPFLLDAQPGSAAHRTLESRVLIPIHLLSHTVDRSPARWALAGWRIGQHIISAGGVSRRGFRLSRNLADTRTHGNQEFRPFHRSFHPSAISGRCAARREDAGARGLVRGIDWAMFSTATGFSRALDADRAALELAAPVEAGLGGAGAVGGALLLATSASGDQPSEVGQALGRLWPGAVVVGTTFEGLLAGGRVFRDQPAVGIVAWAGGGGEPVPLILESGVFDRPEDSLAQLKEWISEAAGPARDLLLLFPDSLASGGLEASLAGINSYEQGPLVAGAAASGVAGTQCLAFSAEGVEPGATVGLLVPGGAGSGGECLQLARGSRFASPWLEIGACRERWIDLLEAEPPVDWIRRQLGLEPTTPLEPYLDRLLVRIRDAPASSSVEACEESDDFVERFVIGLDMRRGSISIPGKFRRGAQLAFALPDADRARDSLRRAVEALPESGTVLQFACRARDAALHGDDDMESALVDYAAGNRGSIGMLAPFQIGPSGSGSARVLVHQTVLAAFGIG